MDRFNHLTKDEFIKIKTTLSETPGISVVPNADWMVFNATGNGNHKIPRSFRVSIYQRKNGTLTLVCQCMNEFQKLMAGKNPWIGAQNSGKEKIQIDDSGWGMPLNGMLVGLFIPSSKSYSVREVSVEAFHNGTYLTETREAVLKLLAGYSKDRFYIELCTGYVFKEARDFLRKAGWTVVSQKIAGYLQKRLEGEFHHYLVTEFGFPEKIGLEDYMGLYAFAKKLWNEGYDRKKFKWQLDKAKPADFGTTRYEENDY